MRRLRDSSAARAARTDDVAYLLHISKAGGSSLCAAAIKDARLRTIHPFIGLHTGSETALALLREWRACSLELECIAPGNSPRRDHRQDQAALTVLAWKHHVQGTCTRQIVSLIVHVEGVKVPCAAA